MTYPFFVSLNYSRILLIWTYSLNHSMNYKRIASRKMHTKATEYVHALSEAICFIRYVQSTPHMKYIGIIIIAWACDTRHSVIIKVFASDFII